MKKQILGGLLVVAIAAIAAFNMSMNTQENQMSALMLANVEALAQNEYTEAKWYVYVRPAEPGYAPGYNCTPDGGSKCDK